MEDTKGNYVIVYNGEIYNFKEIRSQLSSYGHRFNTDCDTEVVLYSYIHWGADCVNQFNGIFAFAIYDKQKKKVFLHVIDWGLNRFTM